MINLLPFEEKQKLLLERKEKLTVVLGVIVLVSLICLILVLLSIKFYILADTDYQKNILAEAKQKSQTQDFANFNSIIQKYNKTLAQVDSFYKKETYFNKALENITGVSSPKGLYLTNISLSRDKAGIIQANVSGISDTRDSLLIFKQNIEKTQEIINSSFSSDSWISPKNVKFSLTFSLK